MRNFKRFSAILLNIAAFYVLTQPLCAQDNLIQSNETAVAESVARTMLVDEFGRIGDCDLSARLDNLIINIQRYPNSKAHIVIYGGHDILPSEYDKQSRYILRTGNRVSRYLTMTRGFAPELITIVDGGIRKTQTTELWLVPENGELPQPSRTIAAPKLPQGKTYLFDKTVLYGESAEFELSASPAETEQVAEENTAEDELETAPDKPEGVNQESVAPEAETPDEAVEERLSEQELYELKFDWTRQNFAETVKSEKGARAVIVYYADEQVHDTSKIYAHLLEGKARMANSADLKIENFEIVYGGYRKSIEFEMWIVPANGAMPKLTPAEKPQQQTEENSEIK